MSELTKVEIVNGSGQTVRISLDADALEYVRKQVRAGDLESVTVLKDDAPKAAPRKTAAPAGK